MKNLYLADAIFVVWPESTPGLPSSLRPKKCHKTDGQRVLILGGPYTRLPKLVPRTKNGLLDQSCRYSRRPKMPSIILYSPVSVTSFRSCATPVPVANPSRSLNHSRRGVNAHLLVG